MKGTKFFQISRLDEDRHGIFVPLVSRNMSLLNVPNSQSKLLLYSACTENNVFYIIDSIIDSNGYCILWGLVVIEKQNVNAK